mmetsp:Transcript_34900/g.92792  ORF Transcript_34900/g.92792 Transcript_34900/m.92792 type:complete len:583 (-) Transcript_34900:139-1887(-)
MAERVRLSLPSGQRTSHRLAWGDLQLGSAGNLGSLEWSVVVLDELTIDLEVSVQLSGQAAAGGAGGAAGGEGGADAPGLVLLQEVARGRTFRGTFDPTEDPRLGGGDGGSAENDGVAGSRVEAVIFDFNNAFSWWTDKEVELVCLRVRPGGPPASMVPPLRLLQPLAALPRSICSARGAFECGVAPGLATLPPRGAWEASLSDREEVLRFASSLDEWLAAAEARRPAEGSAAAVAGGALLQEVLERVVALRGLCKEASAKVAEVPARTVVGQNGSNLLPLTAELLAAQDDRTSGAVIDCLSGDPIFDDLARRELSDIVARDTEDGEKLAEGVAQAVEKGVLPADLVPPIYEQIDVMGKTADQVAEEIIAALPKQGGCVLILVGLSGTGKGTTVEKMKQKLPNAATWSNGNCFRALTLLAATYCAQQSKGFDAACLTPENLAAWADMLEFVSFDGIFDIRIRGLGLDVRVSEVANTLLKEPRVSKNIPAVAKETQGEVVKFAGEAVRKMGEAGTVVLLEGREQTLNFIPSPYRFCLTMSDTTVIGARRAAQRIAAAAAPRAAAGEDAAAAVRAALAEVAGSGR